jgi:hypothetical protein
MRVMLAVLVGVACGAPAFARDTKEPAAARRYGVEADLKTYPQNTPKETLASVLKAIESKRADYLTAQLADPEWVDRRVKDTGGKFDDLVKEAAGRLIDDPGPARLLQRFLQEGEWDVKDDRASVHLKENKERWGYFRKDGGRWFLENRYKPDMSDK